MGELWRSKEMTLVQFLIQLEHANEVLDELGKLGLVEFRDLNPHVNAFQRHFINEVKRADEMERKLRFFRREIDDYNSKVQGTGRKIILPDPDYHEIAKFHVDELEAKFDEYEKQITNLNQSIDAVQRNVNQLIELRHVLEKDVKFFSRALQREEEEEDVSIQLEGEANLKSLGFISGVIHREKFSLFERVIFRATRGNIFMKFSEITEDIDDPNDAGKRVKKNVFIIFFPGTALKDKIRKICESFGANVYLCPESSSERKNLLDQVTSKLGDLAILLNKGRDQRVSLFSNIAVLWNSWFVKIRQEKGIYHTLNKFSYEPKTRRLIGEGWVPLSSLTLIKETVNSAYQRSGSSVPPVLNPIRTKSEPPTYFETNKFTSAFQGIVDSYGIARYREINPAVFTIVTFPYEFGIMFGDVGHGFLLLLFALALIYKERDWEGRKINEMIEMFYGGRYLILLMALFATYQGALYNEFFSLPMNFGSAWKWQGFVQNNTFERWDPNPSKTYVFGVDPVWKGSSNELLYYNSMKMKMSIIIGVTQMSLGIFLHLLNAIHFKLPLDIFFEFLPRIVFLWCIFGYLSLMIIIKWCTDWIGQDLYNAEYVQYHNLNSTSPVPYRGTSDSPVLLNELIFMILTPPEDQRNALYPGQYNFQTVLVIIALVCVPLMMCAKPYCLWRANKNKLSSVEFIDNEPTVDEEGEYKKAEDKEGGEGEEEFNFGEIMVHQGLETIEFVLGSVSHTASYLRLWALSLAHSELATVFWDKVVFTLLRLGPEYQLSFIVTALCMFVAHSVWFFITLLVMMFMEGLSAFLHALRLHWVEFQSKFYKGDGRPFQPFSFKQLTNPQSRI